MENLSYIAALRLLQSAEQVRDRLAGDFASIHGISVNEFFFLMHLEKAPLHRMSRVELAKRLNVNASTVTRMAAPMEKIGLVSKKTDDRDARLSFVVLSRAGHKKLLEAKQTFSKQAGYVFQDRWNEKEIEQLAILLHRLIADAPGDLSRNETN